jgi:hypothetical protein
MMECQVDLKIAEAGLRCSGDSLCYILKKWDIEADEKSPAKNGMLVHPGGIIVAVFIAHDILVVQDIGDANSGVPGLGSLYFQNASMNISLSLSKYKSGIGKFFLLD